MAYPTYPDYNSPQSDFNDYWTAYFLANPIEIDLGLGGLVTNPIDLNNLGSGVSIDFYSDPKVTLVEDLKAKVVSESQIDLSWTKNPTAIGGYQIVVGGEDATGKMFQNHNVLNNVTSLSIKKLKPNTKYVFTIRGSGITMFGKICPQISATTLKTSDKPPAAPPDKPPKTAFGFLEKIPKWGYWAIGGAVLAIGVVVAVVMSKKKT